MKPYIGVNCQYCGEWDCGPASPICHEQQEGKPSNHPCRAFKAGDFVSHPVYGKGQVAFVLPIEKGLRITFDNVKTNWYSPQDITNINHLAAAPTDSAGNIISLGNTIMYPLSKGGAGNGACIRTGTVKKIGEASHRGYGYYTRKLSIVDDKTGKTVTHSYPANCIILGDKS